MILYNIPGRCVVNMGPDLLAELAQIDGIEAVKQANSDELQPIDGLAVLAGNDDILAANLDQGGAGGICVASHIVGNEMRRLFDEPEARAEIDACLRDVYATLFLTASPTCTKAALNLLGHDVGGCRLPMVEADEHELDEVKRDAGCTRAARAGRHRVSGTLRVLPLGGLGEIGKNMTVVEYDGRIVVVDFGLRFPTAEMMGIDLVLPDFTYLREHVDAIEAIVITHGHEDHIGALPWVLRELGETSVPVIYGGQLTVAMGRSKLDEHRLREAKLEVLPTGQPVKAGPFEIELVHLTHSIPDMCGVILRCELGTVLFTGDYKFDQTPVGGAPADVSRLAELGRDGVLLLCGDSTNADRPGIAVSESTIGPNLERVFARCKGRIVVTSFASNIHRVQQVIDAAVGLNRKVCLVGRSMRKNVNIGRTLGHIVVPEGTLVAPRELEQWPDDRVVIISTGSQGEPLSALRRMAYRDHNQVELREGDTVVFSATPIPGNERAVNETIDRLYQIGCEVITPREENIHASGHGYQEEIKLMLNLTRPRYVMPVHGDYKRLRLHSQLAQAVGVPEENIFQGENGLPLEITQVRRRLGQARDRRHGLRRRRRHRRRRRRRPARPPHALRGRHLHHRRDRLRAGRLLRRPTRGARPRRALPRRQQDLPRRPPRGRRGLARQGRRRAHHRDRRARVDAPRRPRGLHLREAQAPPDGAAGRRRGLDASPRRVLGIRTSCGSAGGLALALAARTMPRRAGHASRSLAGSSAQRLAAPEPSMRVPSDVERRPNRPTAGRARTQHQDADARRPRTRSRGRATGRDQRAADAGSRRPGMRRVQGLEQPDDARLQIRSASPPAARSPPRPIGSRCRCRRARRAGRRQRGCCATDMPQ